MGGPQLLSAQAGAIVFICFYWGGPPLLKVLFLARLGHAPIPKLLVGVSEHQHVARWISLQLMSPKLGLPGGQGD